MNTIRKINSYSDKELIIVFSVVNILIPVFYIVSLKFIGKADFVNFGLSFYYFIFLFMVMNFVNLLFFLNGKSLLKYIFLVITVLNILSFLVIGSISFTTAINKMPLLMLTIKGML